MEGQSVKRLVRSKSGLRIVAADDKLQSPFILCEPQWIPDNETTCCMECRRKFDFITRRHHCRRCGQVYCSPCCSFKLELPRMGFVDPVRQCKGCVEVSRRENDFFEREIKILISGANLYLESETTPMELNCKLSPDHRSLMLDMETGIRWQSVQFSSITNLCVLCSPEQNPGMFLSYTDESGEMKQMTLVAAQDVSKRQVSSWLTAIHNGYKLASQSRQEELEA